MAETVDVDTLKRRGRRRLVGAIALVLAAVIVLPVVFESEPKQVGSLPSVRAPAEDDSSFTPKVTPKSSATPAAAPKPQAAPEKAQAKAAEKPAPEKPAASPDAERKRAEAAAKERAESAEKERALSALADAQFIVPIAALANPEKVRDLTETLKAAKLPYYTEPIATAKGPVTRVRAGPFASRDAAEKALQQLKDLGLKPGNVTTKS
ncbi:MAG: SPOR domain-containing protein [Burkholderiales bacterium]